MSYKRSHDSPIPKITLWNFAAKSPRLSQRLETYDKVESHRNFSPPFKRDWAYSPTKRLNNPRKCEISQRYNPGKGSSNIDMIDSYISKVLQECGLREIDRPESRHYLKHKKNKNAFDKFFEEHGDEEEQRLVNYVKNCSLYE